MNILKPVTDFFNIDNSDQAVIDVDKDIVLYLEGLTVSFDGFKALNDLNLYVRDGELRCLIGANGAGISKANGI